MARLRSAKYFAAAALAFGPVCIFAADEPAPEHAALFRQLDKNVDGTLSRDEVPDEQRRLVERLFAQHDSDSDGKLSLAEFAAGMKEGRPRGEGPGPRPEGREGPPPDAEAFFKRIDRNGDGKLTKDDLPAERREQGQAMIERADTDKDGAVTLEEFRKAMPGGPRPGGEPRADGRPRPEGPGPEARRPADELIRVLDADRDGEISADEIAAAAASLKSIDKNGDGKLTREEWGPPGPPPPAGRPGEGFRESPELALAYFMKMDRDGDKKLSKDEAPPRMQENFSKVDRNGDGFVDEPELREMITAIRGGIGGRRPEGAPGPEGRRPEGAPGTGERRPGAEGPRPERKPEGEAKPREGGPPREGEGRRPAAEKGDDAKAKPEGRKPKKDDGAPAKE